MDYENMLFETSEHVATLTLHRPEKLNALSPALLAELTHALDTINADHDIGVIILTGAGRAFSSGFDIAPGRHRPDAPTTANWDATHLAPRSVMKLWSMRQPTDYRRERLRTGGWQCAGAGRRHRHRLRASAIW